MDLGLQSVGAVAVFDPAARGSTPPHVPLRFRRNSHSIRSALLTSICALFWISHRRLRRAALGGPLPIRINISRMPPCQVCGSQCPDISRQASISHISMPKISPCRVSAQDLVNGCVNWPIDIRQGCVAGDPKCDAALHLPANISHDCHAANAAAWESIILFIDCADPDICKNTTKIAAPGTLRFAGADWAFSPRPAILAKASRQAAMSPSPGGRAVGSASRTTLSSAPPDDFARRLGAHRIGTDRFGIFWMFVNGARPTLPPNPNPRWAY